MTTYMKKILIHFPLARQEMNYKEMPFILGVNRHSGERICNCLSF